MREIVKSWLDYCQKDDEIIRGEFDTLFMDNITDEEVRAIFKPFVSSKKLSKRMIRYLKDYRNDGIVDTTIDKRGFMEKLLRLDFEERKPDVENINLFSKVIFPTKYKFNPDFEEVEEDMMGDVFSQKFNNHFRRSKVNEKPKIYPLYQAISCISSYYSFTQYLFQPLVNMNYTASHIYEFLMRGGTYAVIEDTVYYSFKEELS
ncbi:hypothetical protein [Tenacibaculum sp. M341]|uniref:hypothetical protein n=1 Tax=Tenacibaculum sp. M341 TaxID=2530339 RepID=UPI00104C0C1A|nr:hypothetical protein [Tenacibaculum sp. M341]TCI93042.1 hypothetical protein EYW44_05325 [Tenacibaculum sp. M341]